TETLEKRGHLLKLSFITHSYPHDWRTKKPTIFRATSQWFASIKAFRDNILDEIKNVNWYPNWEESRMYNMVRGREDWCISRQRVWVVHILVVYGEEGISYSTNEKFKHVNNLFNKYGSKLWYEY